MSKKTKTLKQAARIKRKPRARNARTKRPNPLKSDRRPVAVPGLLGDPVFMGHVAAALFRALELNHVICRMPEPGEIVAPEEIAGTVNSESPDAQQGPDAKE